MKNKHLPQNKNNFSGTRVVEKLFLGMGGIFFLCAVGTFLLFSNTTFDFQLHDTFFVAALFHFPLIISCFLLIQGLIYTAFRFSKIALLIGFAKTHFFLVAGASLVIFIMVAQCILNGNAAFSSTMLSIFWGSIAAIFLGVFFLFVNIAFWATWSLIKGIGERRVE